jgi:hypothetical protein
MTLPSQFEFETLCYPCPLCGHNLEKNARWFRITGCHKRLQMTYDAKVKLFADYERKHRPA